MEEPHNPQLYKRVQYSLPLPLLLLLADLIALLLTPQPARFSPDPADNPFPLLLISKSSLTVMLCAAPCQPIVHPLWETYQIVAQSPLVIPARNQLVKLRWNLRMQSSRLSSRISKHPKMNSPMNSSPSSLFSSPCPCQGCHLLHPQLI